LFADIHSDTHVMIERFPELPDFGEICILRGAILKIVEVLKCIDEHLSDKPHFIAEGESTGFQAAVPIERIDRVAQFT
jgi:hypothetical protein